MLYIRHRINTLAELAAVPETMGIELDLRDQGDQIILQHDAYKTGEPFEAFLKKFHHPLIVLNVKSEGLEEKALELVKKYRVPDYFFLDLSFPMIVKLARQGITQIAVRYSEYETLEQCLAVKEFAQWVWVDCFTHCPLDALSYEILKNHFKICLVSPELQGHPLEEIQKFREQLKGFEIDAVCTKRPDLWQS